MNISLSPRALWYNTKEHFRLFTSKSEFDDIKIGTNNAVDPNTKGINESMKLSSVSQTHYMNMNLSSSGKSICINYSF